MQSVRQHRRGECFGSSPGRFGPLAGPRGPVTRQHTHVAL